MNQAIQRTKHVIDADDQSAGRLASKVAFLLMGKNKVNYEPHMDQGDMVEINNVAKLKFTGNKLVTKEVWHHSGHPHGLKMSFLGKIFQATPDKLFRKMVYRMLPKNKLRPEMIKRLTITK